MSVANPIPRETRRQTFTAAADQVAFGPTSFRVYDPLDVAVFVKAPATSSFLRLAADAFTVVLAGGAPNFATVTLDTAPGLNAQVRVDGRRTHERTTDVTQGGVVRSLPLERELDRQSVVLQELRRDADDALRPNADLDAAVTAAQNAAGTATGAAGTATGAAGTATTAAGTATAKAAEAVAAALLLATQALSNGTDLNTLVARGTYVVTNPANAPVTDAAYRWTIDVINDASGSPAGVVQTARLVVGGVGIVAWHRRRPTGSATWSPWINLGAGSSTGLDPVDYGAVADGVADDTAALESCFAASALLRVPADLGDDSRVYRVTEAVAQPSHCHIVGRGAIIDHADVATGLKAAIYAHGAAGTGANAPTLAANGTRGASSVTLSSGGGAIFAVDELVLLTSDANYPWVGSASAPIGEWKRIRSKSGDTITFTTPLLNAYATANNARLRKCTLVEDVSIMGVTIRGAGLPADDMRGVSYRYVKDFRVELNRFDGQHNFQFEASCCVDGFVERNQCDGVYYDTSSGYNFYGVALLSACDNIVVRGNRGRRNRHLVVTGNWSSDGIHWGEPVFCHIDNNHQKDSEWGAAGVSYAFEVHTVGSYCLWTNNSADGCYSGMHFKGGRGHVVDGLIVKNWETACVSFGRQESGGLTRDILVKGVSGHTCAGSAYAETETAAIAFLPGTGGAFNNIQVLDSQFVECRPSGMSKGRGVYAPSAAYTDVIIAGNLFTAGPTDAGANIYAAIFASADGITFSRNTTVGFRDGVWLNDSDNCEVEGNKFVINSTQPGTGVGVYSKGSRNLIRFNTTRNLYKGYEIDTASVNNVVINNVSAGLGGTLVTVGGGATGTVNRDNDAI